MIILEASKGIKQSTGINFKVLSDVLSILIQGNHRKKIEMTVKVQKSRQPGVSYCEADDNNNFKICLDQTTRQTRKFIFGSILHELRHCCQLNIWNYWANTCKFKTYEDYFNSKEERDARKIEKLTRQVIKLYDLHVDFHKQYAKIGLNKLG